MPSCRSGTDFFRLATAITSLVYTHCPVRVRKSLGFKPFFGLSGARLFFCTDALHSSSCSLLDIANRPLNCLNIGCDVRLLFGGPLCFHLLKELLIAIQVIAQLLKFTQSNLSMSKAPLALDDQRHWRGGWWLGRLAHESRRSHGEDWRCFLIRDGHSRRHRHHNTWPVFPSLMIHYPVECPIFTPEFAVRKVSYEFQFGVTLHRRIIVD